MSIPGSANISRTNEIAQYTPPEISRNSVPHIGPISDEIFDQYVQRWQNRQRPVRPVYQSGQTGPPPTGPTGPSGQFVSNQHEVSTSTQPNSSSHFDKMLTDYKNDLAQIASGYREAADGVDVEVQFLEPGDWRADIFNYLKDLARGGTQKDKTQGHEIRSDRG